MKNPLSQRQLQIFATPKEKGHREWDAFSAVHENRAGMYRVAMPHKPIVVKSPGNLLRIIRPEVRTFHIAH
jgi:hypothetical protein